MLREDQRPLSSAAPEPAPHAAPRSAAGAAAKAGGGAASRAPGARRPALHPGSDVNPYTHWVHEHPHVLLAEPTPADLRRRLAAAPGDPAGPIELDLGCGSGNFLLGRARRDPTTRFVGFELRYKRLVKAARKVERAELPNVWLLREVAERCADYFEPGSLHAVYVHFPDPWPRRSDWKKRLVGRPLLEALERLLEPGGRFQLKTDHSGYFLHVLSLLPGLSSLRLATLSNGLAPCPAGEDEVPTEFEQLFRGLRKPVYRLVLERPPAAGRS